MNTIFEGTNYHIKAYEDARGTNLHDDNVDVEIVFEDGTRYFAAFFTLANIHTLFDKNKKTGECKSGLYLWSSDMLLVETLTHDVIIQTVQDLIEKKELGQAFSSVPRGYDPAG